MTLAMPKRTVKIKPAAVAAPPPPPPEPVPIRTPLWVTVVINGGIIQSPVWEEHPHRAKNWLACIQAAPTSPGGLRREFLPYGRGEFRYMVGALEVFDAVEFAADYLSMAGNRTRKRWYGVVRELTSAKIVVEEVGSAVTALLRSLELINESRLKRAALCR